MQNLRLIPLSHTHIHTPHPTPSPPPPFNSFHTLLSVTLAFLVNTKTKAFYLCIYQTFLTITCDCFAQMQFIITTLQHATKRMQFANGHQQCGGQMVQRTTCITHVGTLEIRRGIGNSWNFAFPRKIVCVLQQAIRQSAVSINTHKPSHRHAHNPTGLIAITHKLKCEDGT